MKADITVHRRRASAPLPPPQLRASPEAEVPLPPDPHIGVSGEQYAHPEIRRMPEMLRWGAWKMSPQRNAAKLPPCEAGIENSSMRYPASD
jgi:hypothetical protein